MLPYILIKFIVGIYYDDVITSNILRLYVFCFIRLNRATCQLMFLNISYWNSYCVWKIHIEIWIFHTQLGFYYFTLYSSLLVVDVLSKLLSFFFINIFFWFEYYDFSRNSCIARSSVMSTSCLNMCLIQNVCICADCASKHAFEAFHHTLRSELATGPFRVHVLVVQPGYVLTSVSRNALRADGSLHGSVY